MTRKFWGAVMLVSLLVTSGAGYFWFGKMSHIEESQMVTEPAPSTPIQPAVPETQPAPPVQEEEKPEVQTKSGDTRNILFRFPRASAKSVYIVGDFNDWHRQPFKRADKGWEITLALKPGSYQYLFVVDDKRIKDPSNNKIADGKSLINVKPK